MASIFRKDDNHVEKPNRNTFDMSFQNNLTTKFGVLKPVFCQEVIPGDTFKIKPTFALRFLPQVFPVQTRMRAHLHFFYVRNRCLWKDWEDFIGKTRDGLIPPYLSFNDDNKSMLKVGGICDSFGVPVVTNSDVGQTLSYFVPLSSTTEGKRIRHYYDFETGQFDSTKYVNFDWNNAGVGTTAYAEWEALYRKTATANSVPVFALPSAVEVDWQNDDAGKEFIDVQVQYGTPNATSAGKIAMLFESDGLDRCVAFNVNAQANTIRVYRESSVGVSLTKFRGYLAGTTSTQITLGLPILASASPEGVSVENIPFGDSFPYWNTSSSSTDNALKISALPFRGYEAIYNSFYRNAENNPLLIDGVPEYNKYNRTYEGGADTNNYELFNRNWEDDFLTTALPSPQQGTAPLVGITNRGDAPYIVTLSDEDGNLGRVKFSYVNGQVQVTPASENSDVIAGQLNEHFMQQTNVGFSIQDFRNVNSFTRWLENNIRRGFKYRDQIKGHYGVTVRYDVLDMPEFIGGVSRDVSVQQITSMAETNDANLGDIAGQSYVYGDGEQISHFADEHGYIIGILSVVPVSNYSQMMPKHLMKRDALDYYFPEFGKIGMQPILNKEVTTLESISRGNQDEVFGYQRAWYDYISRVDEVHGLFTTQFRDFLIGRTFRDVPKLSASFSTIQSDQLNNIFYVDNDEDKILGQIYFDATGIRPIPLYGLPSIE